jgi:CheY-like chemotaxis protein
MKNLKILLAEDHEISQKMATRLLEKRGYSVVAAENGEEVLENLDGEAFDLVLMDVQMPVMDGIIATQKIRNLKSDIRDIPIIAMTAHAMKGDRQRCLDAGMDDYISKPIDVDDLFEKIEQWGHSQAMDSLEITTENHPTSQNETDFSAPVQIGKALERASGDREFLTELYQHFITEMDDRIQKFQKYIDLGEAETLADEAHSLKGAASNLSAGRLADVAYQLEQLGRQNDLSNGGQLLEALGNELNDLKAFVNDNLL